MEQLLVGNPGDMKEPFEIDNVSLCLHPREVWLSFRSPNTDIEAKVWVRVRYFPSNIYKFVKGGTSFEGSNI